MLEVALDRLLGVVARMENMTVPYMRVVRSLLVRTGLMVLRRFLVMSRGVLVVFSRLLMMFSRLFGHGILRLVVSCHLIGSKNSLLLSSHPGPAPLDLGPTKGRIKLMALRGIVWVIWGRFWRSRPGQNLGSIQVRTLGRGFSSSRSPEARR